MICKLKGVIEGFGEDLVQIDVGGVVYEAACSSRTLRALPRIGEAGVIFIEMVVREDLIRLYGFASEAEKTWFRVLVSVQGVGARVALALLSVLTPSELSSAIALGDKAMIGRANGVGPKLALRIVTELKGKLPALGGPDAGVLGLQSRLGEGIASSNAADAVSALANLGYSSIQASSAVARVIAREGDGATTEKLIRLGLREMGT